MDRPCDLAGLARRLGRLPPSCGPVRLLAVDGHAGSGKSTFAALLARELARVPAREPHQEPGPAPVLPLDDIASHAAFFGWTGRFGEQVIDPLSHGEDARYQVYDWQRRAFTHEAELPAAPVVLVEGVGAGRRALRPSLACLLWMEVPPLESWRRGRRRDGPELADFWSEWTRAESEHFSTDPSRSHANLLVRQIGKGYRILEGPMGFA